MINYKIRFWLRDNNYLQCRITHKKEKVKFSTGIKIDPAKWDAKSQKIKGNSALTTLANDKLDQIKAEIHQKAFELKAMQRAVTPAMILAAYRGDLVHTRGLLDYFRRFVQGLPLASDDGENDGVSPKTIQVYDRYFKYVEQFVAREFKMKDVPLSEIREETAGRLRKFLLEQKKFERYSAERVIGFVKRLLQKAYNNGYISRNPWAEVKYYKKPWKNVPIVYLEQEELQRLEDYPFRSGPLQRVADDFIIRCYTALADQDVRNHTRDWLIRDVNGQYWLEYTRHKTRRFGRLVRVPLLPKVVELIRKYDRDLECIKKNQLWPTRCNQVTNRMLKEICAVEAINIQKPLTTHIARKTCGMLLLNAGVPQEIVAAVLGDTVQVMQQHYAKILDQTVAREVNKAWAQIRRVAE